jgi:lincosamide nucleotidyltransferase B/F
VSDNKIRGEILIKDTQTSASEILLRRLAEITQAAVGTGQVRAVLALGSIGLEMARIDQYSDLDVWIIAEDGFNQGLIDDLSWLTAVCPIGYRYKNGASGYKILFEDGLFAELDVFEMGELAALPFSEARIVWKAEGVPTSIGLPQRKPHPRDRSLDELLGEALTNLYVGLGRFHRGEKLTAMRFIQSYAVDRLLEMAHLIESEQPAWPDLFGQERRFERRFPVVAAELPHFLQGYDRTPESAQAILSFLDKHFEINQAIKQAILERLAPTPAE